MQNPHQRLRTAARHRLSLVTVAGDGVRVGDVVSVGGIPHRVKDVRCVFPARARLEFEDGNVYVVGRSHPIEVSRRVPVIGQGIPGGRSRR
ncbi:hypothetical protein [Streptomyces luteireticuli]|uniref:Uncharacterized protein n=1 Tax=Streptomyces luteireticuli TaxID=173858 RepID=A0ABP3IV34_9ACTN